MLFGLQVETNNGMESRARTYQVTTTANDQIFGFLMGINLQQQHKDNIIIDKVRGKLFHWTNKKLSLAGSVLVSNQVILASI